MNKKMLLTKYCDDYQKIVKFTQTRVEELKKLSTVGDIVENSIDDTILSHAKIIKENASRLMDLAYCIIGINSLLE